MDNKPKWLTILGSIAAFIVYIVNAIIQDKDLSQMDSLLKAIGHK